MASPLLQERLPVEIVHKIIKELHAQNQSYLLPLALVSHDFYYLVMPVLYRSIQISLAFPRSNFEASIALLKRLSNCNAEITNAIRSVDVYGTQETHLPSTQHKLICEPQIARHRVVLDQLANLIPRLKNLTFLNWRICWDIPEKLLLNLCQTCPSTQLSVGFSSLQCAHFDTIVEMAGEILEKLDIVIGLEEDVQPGKRKLLWVLEGCPNLKVLKIEKNDRSYGLDGQSDPWPEIQPAKTLPRLLKLSIDERMFRPEDLLAWGEVGGWTQLEEATLKDHCPLQYLQGCEKTLRSISLTNASGDTPGAWGEYHAPGHAANDIEKALIQVCSRLECLEALRLRGTYVLSIPLKALKTCGKTLKLLEINTRSLTYPVPGKNPPLDALDTVRRYCPNIATLGINIYRTDNDWPYEHLAALSRWPNLTHLILYAEYSTCINAPRAAILDIAAAKHIFHYLLDRKICKPLEKTTIHRGDDCYMAEGVSAYEYEMRVTKAVFHCTAARRDGVTEASVVQEGGVVFEEEWKAGKTKGQEVAKVWEARRALGMEGGEEIFLFDRRWCRPSVSNGLESTRSNDPSAVEHA